MAAEETGDNSCLLYVSSVAAPKAFQGQMELNEEPRVTQPPEKGPLMHVADYGHLLQETGRRRHRSNAVGAPSSYDERHPSVDVHTASTETVAAVTTASVPTAIETEEQVHEKAILSSEETVQAEPCPSSELHQATSSAIRRDNVFEVAGSVLDVSQETIQSEIKPYSSYVAERYLSQELTASSTTAFPSLTGNFHHLTMIRREKFRRTKKNNKIITTSKSGKKDDHNIIGDVDHVEIKNILRKSGSKRIVVLIESAPGGGKSTLCLHICQQWGRHKLFVEYDLVILVRLRDPEVQKAKSIADLLPCRDDEMARRVAAEIVARDGRKVLWILDGWDELPRSLQETSSFFLDMINAPNLRKSPVPLNDIIVTSRPISSSKLQTVATSRFEILGFTVKQQEKYFEECFKLDAHTNDYQEFLDTVQDSTVLQSLCCIPQYAAYIVNLYLCEGIASLATEYEIFSAVIVNCVHQYFVKIDKVNELDGVESMDDLSTNEATKSPFDLLCELAYNGVMKNQVSFSRSDLPKNLDHLGLLQGVQSLASHGGSKLSYHFPNLSTQEVLASYYLATKVPVSKQPEKLKELFHEPRFSAVLKFFAAITKLKSPEIHNILIKVIQEMDFSKLVSLLHCLHEAQNDTLCQSLAKELSGVLYLFGKPLSPLDGYVVGYLLSNICISIKVHEGLASVTGEFRVDLDNCQLGNQGCKSLVKGVRKYLNRDCAITSQATLELAGNAITEEGVTHLSELLESNIVSKLTLGHLLSGNRIESRGLQLISKALITNKSLTELDLSNCLFDITYENGPVLKEMLECNKSLKCLLFRNTHFGDTGIAFITTGLSSNTAITALRLYNCGITSNGAKHIGDALKVNACLKLLNLSHNPIGGESAKYVAEGLMHNCSLTTCVLDSCGINDDGVRSLACVVKENASIESLWLEDNPDISVKKCVLIDALSKSKSIKKVILPDQFTSVIIETESDLNEKRKLSNLPIVELRVSDLSSQCMLVPPGL